MLDPKEIRENPEKLKNNLKKRFLHDMVPLVDEWLKIDKEWREKKKELDMLRAKRNKISQEINMMKKEGQDISEKAKEAKEVALAIEILEPQVEELYKRWLSILKRFPNYVHEDVPIGEDDSKNVPIKFYGKKPEFDFKPKSHVDLLEILDVGDTKRAAKVAGSRFYYLKNQLTMLDLALQQFALEHLIKKGFIPVLPPFMLRREPYEGITSFSDFEEQLYKIEGEDLYLIATSEHPLGAMHMNEVLHEDDLPLKYAGVSACFRREAGSHGKDTKGIFRVHQFNKIEQFVYCKPEDSWKIHLELLQNAEEIFQALGLHYRVVDIASGDLGDIAARKYDIEVWMPAQEKYREVVSCSNCTDYQARSLNIKFQRKGVNKIEYVHTLNSTAIATTRAIVAILENYQDEEGNVHIPKVLHKYLPEGMEVIRIKKK